MSEKSHGIQWHSPFRGAIKIELEPYKDTLEYIDEKILTKKPLQIDLLVIKKSAAVKIDNPIGKIFRGINIMEYKSPTDYISIDDFYKVSAYAYLLKADADTEDGISFHDITISLVSSTVPKRAFEHLEQVRGYEITKPEKGIYYLRKEKEIPVQCLILEELSSMHKWMAALTDNITSEKLYNIVADYDPAEKNEYKESIMETVIKANYEFVKNLREEESMSKEVLELFRPEIDAEVNRRVQEEVEKKVQEEVEKKVQEEVDKKVQDAVRRTREIVFKFYKLNTPISQIIQATDLSEAEVLEIVGEN